MRDQLSWMVGGQQGEGIESTGNVLSAVLNRLGYHVYGYRHFSSRIKGGHTNFKIRIANQRVLAMQDQVDVLVAFDQDSVNKNADQLHNGSVVIVDGNGDKEVSVPENRDVQVLYIPMTQLAKDAGAVIMKNMVGAGASAALLGIDTTHFEEQIAEQFGHKGDRLVQANRTAFHAGHESALGQISDREALRLAPGDGRRRHLMSGDEAVAFGALAGGCRMVAAYPITPATEVMHWMIGKLPKYGGVVVQAEDEIAAITMTIGASYSGVRAMTSTSGPGFSLMMEALGYAGMIEAPLVIVDVQRGGPSTGMPTKHEQSDLFEILYGSHGDMPRIVLAPTTVEECFYYGAEAFNLAEKYQTPVIIALDLALGLCMQTVEDLDFDRVKIERGSLVTQDDLDKLNGDPFKRYAFTEDGVSPRSIPGLKGGLHLATGVEHDETGHITEDRINRIHMMEKRLRKIAGVPTDNGMAFEYHGNGSPDLLLLGWGSATGPIGEAAQVLQSEGINVSHAAVKYLSPLPVAALLETIGKAGKVIVIENNAQGQLCQVLRQELDAVDKSKLQMLLKYDGVPFVASEIAAHCKEVL